MVAAGDQRRPLPEPKITAHIWAANLPNDIPPGNYILEVEAIDMFNHTDRGIRIIEVQ